MILSRAALSCAVWATMLGAAASTRAADICGETVPANRFIDGIPAYAQCAASMTSAVYSDDGIDTSTTSAGTSWVRTQGSDGYQCTELAHRYLYFRWGVPAVPNGNAGVWCDATLPSGLEKATTPIHGDLIVFAPGSCGADSTTGHVAVIDTVNSDGSLTAVQQNVAGRQKYNLTCAACFLHAVANSGAAIDAGVPATTGASGASGAAGSGGATGSGGVTGPGGATGSGGAKGSGGAIGSGGATGSGAATGTGGAMGSGGAIGSGGTTSAAGAPGGSSEGSPSDGCACGLARGRARNPYREGLEMALLVAFVTVGVRRRRRGS